MSAVLRLIPRQPLVLANNLTQFAEVVRLAFNQRRKMLRNPLKGYFEPEVLKDPIFDKRAEQLTIEQFAELTFRMR